MISLCMIVRDEELALPRCLDSVEGIFDEIIIVDTGSTDKTREIAEKRVGKVYDFKWIDDFSAARNCALSLAKGDWLMWLDADDVIEGENRGLLKEQIASLDTEQPDVVMLPYNVGFDECGRVTLSYERERIFRAAAGLRFEGAVHEAVAPRGKVIHGQAAVSHRKLRPNPIGRNLKILEKLAKNGLDPRMRYYYARELAEAGRLEEAAESFRLCAEDESAWRENRLSAQKELSDCLLALGRREESDIALFKALMLGAPRADLCCEIGRRFLEKGELYGAKFWYELAPRQYAENKGGFVHSDCGGYLPYMQLCVIYDRLGEHSSAELYNELAGKIKPESEAYLKNREYFAALRSGSPERK